MAETRPREEATKADENGAAPPAEGAGIEAAGREDAPGEETGEPDTGETETDQDETGEEHAGTRVYFFRRSANSKVEHILGSTEHAAVDRDDGRIEFSAGGDLDLKVGDLVSSRLIASEPIHRVERETRGDEVDYTVWYERGDES